MPSESNRDPIRLCNLDIAKSEVLRSMRWESRGENPVREPVAVLPSKTAVQRQSTKRLVSCAKGRERFRASKNHLNTCRSDRTRRDRSEGIVPTIRIHSVPSEETPRKYRLTQRSLRTTQPSGPSVACDEILPGLPCSVSLRIVNEDCSGR